MSRNDEFAAGHTPRMFPPSTPLFHGSEQDFAPGDVIEPRSKHWAHATPHLHTAKVFGSKVYEVEAVNPSDTWDRRMKNTGNEAHFERLSASGFRVVGAVPKSKKAKEAYQQRAVDAYGDWAKSTGAGYCQKCNWSHEPDQHVR